MGKCCRAGQATDEIWRMRFECWMPKATNTYSKYVILIALPRQQWLHECALLVRYKYIVGLLFFYAVYSENPSLSTSYFVALLVHE